MREKNSPPGGKIQQITSIGGQRGVPTFSIYCASKWAVEGFTEALQQELKPEWNIQLTCIEPGGFRTDWAGRSMAFGEEKNKAYVQSSILEGRSVNQLLATITSMPRRRWVRGMELRPVIQQRVAVRCGRSPRCESGPRKRLELRLRAG